MSRLRVALLSFAATITLFYEYLPPFSRVWIPYDLPAFHYSLADYAHQALRQGRFPAWDPILYCGLPFAGNIQATLFYPPAWLLFLLDANRPHLSYSHLEIFVILHLWIAFLLCYGWLEYRGLHSLACALGAGVFAFSGYMMTQLQHLGLVAGFAWWPLGFYGVDRAHAEGRWRPLWRLAVASAGVVLAGYPPFWATFAFCVTAYAIARKAPWRTLLGTWGALIISLLICAVQLWPAWDAASLAEPQLHSGLEVRGPMFFISYLIPNFWDFGFKVPAMTNFGLDYWYLGAAGLAGIACCARRAWRRSAPALFMAAITAFFVVNPFGFPARFLQNPSLFSGLIRGWYFLAGFTAAAALLAAAGVDDHIRSAYNSVPRWLVLPVLIAVAIWNVRLVLGWRPSGPGFSHGWAGALEPAIGFVLAIIMLRLLAATKGRSRTALACAVLLFTLVEYKAFGTSKRFNATRNSLAAEYASGRFPGLDSHLAGEMRTHPEYRVVFDNPGGAFSLDLRHFGLATPLGMDPLLSTQYRKLVERYGRFTTDREFTIDPANTEALRVFGVRYFITNPSSEQFGQLRAPGVPFRLLPPDTGFYQVFEYTAAQPAYGWSDASNTDGIRMMAWAPEHRAFSVQTDTRRQFRLSEQLYPGWVGSMDGRPMPIERCADAFQCVFVPPGTHELEFRFRPRSLLAGAVLSLLSLGVFAMTLLRS